MYYLDDVVVIREDVGLLALASLVWSTQSQKPVFAPRQTFPNLWNTKILGANHGMIKSESESYKNVSDQIKG